MRILASLLTNQRTALPGPALAAGRTLLGDSVAADTRALGHGAALLGVNSLELALSHGAAILVGSILGKIRCYRKYYVMLIWLP